MKTARWLAVSFVLAHCAPFVAAQDAAPITPLAPPAKPLVETLLTPPAADANPIWSGGSGSTAHLYGEVGVGTYWSHGFGSFFGTGGTVGVTGEHFGAGVSFQEYGPITNKVWTSNRP